MIICSTSFDSFGAKITHEIIVYMIYELLREQTAHPLLFLRMQPSILRSSHRPVLGLSINPFEQDVQILFASNCRQQSFAAGLGEYRQIPERSW